VFLFTSTFAGCVSSHTTMYVIHARRRATSFSPLFPREPDPDIRRTVDRSGGPVSWPPRSPGLNLMDFWL